MPSGVRNSFAALVRPYWQGLRSTARQYVGSSDTEDLVQETLMRAWRAFEAASDREYSRAWLFVILRNVALEWHRSASRRIRIIPQAPSELTELQADDWTAPLASLPATSEFAFRGMLSDHIVAALDAIEPVFREVIVLSVAGELSYREIADVIDCPIGTVMSRMARARRMLRERLSHRLVERSLNKEARS